MKPKRNRFVALLCGAALSLVLAACGSSGYGGSKPPSTMPGTNPPTYPPHYSHTGR